MAIVVGKGSGCTSLSRKYIFLRLQVRLWEQEGWERGP